MIKNTVFNHFLTDIYIRVGSIKRQNLDNNSAMINANLETDSKIQKQVVVVCFGTPSISGDSLGPSVGSLLREKYKTKAFVYGTLDRPINGKNMKEWMTFLKQVHKGAIIVAVDASLGGKSRKGQIILRSDGVCPAAVKGEKSRYGDVGILAVVGESGGDALMELMQVSMIYVHKLAEKVALIIDGALSFCA